MPLKFFICPDGIKRPIEQCLDTCPRPKGRCLSLPSLHALGYSRPFTGKTSTTMLLNPTRMEYLKITEDYSIVPQARAFALLGTQHHRRLEVIAKTIETLKSENKAEDVINTGTLDLLEPDELFPSKWKLVDYKTWGAFSLTKILQKDSYERLKASLQVNDYRLMVQPLGFEISRMFWQITIRDGGTKNSAIYGLDDNRIPMIEADLLDDDYVIDYFSSKNIALLEALNKNELPPPCAYPERWNGRRCKGSLCEVHEFCPEGRLVNKLK